MVLLEPMGGLGVGVRSIEFSGASYLHGPLGADGVDGRILVVVEFGAVDHEPTFLVVQPSAVPLPDVDFAPLEVKVGWVGLLERLAPHIPMVEVWSNHGPGLV